MKKEIMKIILFFYLINHLSASSANWLHSFIDKSTNNWKIRQIIMFTNSSNTNCAKEKQLLFLQIVREIGVVMMDIDKQQIENKLILRKPALLLTSSSALIIVLEKNAHQQLKNVLEYFSMISPVAPRPKCLVIIYDKISGNKVRENLEYAWRLKFLDMTVLVLKSCQNNQPNIYYFNPFNNFTNENSILTQSFFL